MKALMNSLIAIATSIAAIAFTSSCTYGSASKIASSTIKKLVSDNMKEECDADVFNTIKVGYYEENDDDVRYTLRKLAAAGVITYKVERVETSRRVKSGYTFDYRTYRVVDTYKTIKSNVYFVNIALTEEGQKYVVTELPKPIIKEDKYLTPVEFIHYPEFDAPKEDIFPEDQKDNVVAEPKAEEKSVEASPKEEPKTDYEKAKARESFVIKNVKCYSAKVVDVRDIIVEDGKASASYVLEAFDVSPFGRVYNRVYEKSHTLGDVSFIFYQDKKWVVDKVESSNFFF